VVLACLYILVVQLIIYDFSNHMILMMPLIGLEAGLFHPSARDGESGRRGGLRQPASSALFRRTACMACGIWRSRSVPLT
jgi:hypothetical protein